MILLEQITLFKFKSLHLLSYNRHLAFPSLQTIPFLQKMGIRNLVENSLLRLDLLSTSPTFRTRKEPAYETIFGGFVSIVVLGVFYYFLSIQMKSMLSNLTISFNQGIDDNVHATSSIYTLPFAVSIEGVDLSITPRKFIMQLWQHKIIQNTGASPIDTVTSITLSPCNYSDWQSYGSVVAHQFNALGFDKMFCINRDQNITLTGYEGSDDFQYLSLQAHECNQTVDRSCDTVANINSFMNSYLSINDYFRVKIFVLDTVLTPSNHTAITHVLEKNIFLAFSTTVGTIGHINMAQFSLQTDTSLLPIEDYDVDKGVYIETFKTNAISISTPRYIHFDFFRSTKSLAVTRKIGKIDSVLSYVGGLFSLIFTAISFFFGSYSQYKYELYVAQSTLTSKGKPYKSDNFGFWTFLKYACYDWMTTFGIEPATCTKLKNIHEIRQESCEQLDPSVILRRIKHLQDMSRVLLSEHRQMCIYLAEPYSLNQAKKMRNTLTYYDEIMHELRDNQAIERKSENQEGSMLENKNKNAIYNESELYFVKKEEEKELTEDEEREQMNTFLWDAVDRLDREKSEAGENIKARIPERVREYIKQTKKYRNNSEQLSGVREFQMIAPSCKQDRSQMRMNSMRQQLKTKVSIDIKIKQAKA